MIRHSDRRRVTWLCSAVSTLAARVVSSAKMAAFAMGKRRSVNRWIFIMYMPTEQAIKLCSFAYLSLHLGDIKYGYVIKS